MMWNEHLYTIGVWAHLNCHIVEANFDSVQCQLVELFAYLNWAGGPPIFIDLRFEEMMVTTNMWEDDVFMVENQKTP